MTSAQRWLRRLLALHESGLACLPPQMGLSLAQWHALLARCAGSPWRPDSARDQRQILMRELQVARREERQQLAEWLAQHQSVDAAPLHDIIACASLGFNHLWQDLGLDSREELRELMCDCFPSLVRLNVHNMRWKKFFYRQRCLHSEGELICRSPSCDDCSEWAHCFAPEV